MLRTARMPGKPEVTVTRGRVHGRALLSAGAAAALGLLPALLPATAAVADSVSDQQQWVFQMMHVQDTRNVTKGSGVIVAVLDSGVDGSVSDLAGNVIAGQKMIDYTGLSTSPDNPDWGEHGTWMASIIAGHGRDNGADGITGVAPEARILSVRVIPDMNDPGYTKYDNDPEAQIQHELAEGILTAVKDHAMVISMSIGYSAPSSEVRSAIQYAYSRGVVLVASSGNSGNNDTQHTHTHTHTMAPVSFPAEYPGVISVGAVTSEGKPTSFSSGNLSVKVAAPGKKVPAQGRSGQYYTVDGTSPACALVAGVAALIESKYPNISPALVTEALTSTALHPPGGYDVLTGFGIVDAGKALAAAGRLMTKHPEKSQVPLTAHFGSGTAAQPAAPVAPRGTGGLIGYLVLLAVSGVAVLCGGFVLLLGRRARR